jgi:hypothetical protein
MPILVHFLLVYDHAAGRLREELTFQDPTEAIEAYAKLEEKHRDESRVEIVLVGADSIATVRQTHGHYFEPRSHLVVPLPIGEPAGTSAAH